MRIRKPRSDLSESQRRKAEKLYTDYGDFVYRVALGLLEDRFLAEDACQEAFVRVIGNIDRIDESSVNSTRKYLEIAGRNAAIDILRSRGRLDSHEQSADDSEADFPEPGPGPSEILLTRELIEYIKQAVKELKPIYQDAFLLRSAYGHSLEETAGILGISPSAAEKRYFRAKKQIMKRLEEYKND